MATLSDPGVQALVAGPRPNHAVVSTFNEDGSIHSTVVWVSLEDGRLAVNSAVGRKWPTNLERNPAITVLVYDETNPYEYVEVRGRVAEDTHEGADDHINAMAKKYIGQDEYPFRQPGEVRVIFRVAPDSVRYVKAG